MTELNYVIVDVFAEAALRGNPAAVVFDADELNDAQMQALGRSLQPRISGRCVQVMQGVPTIQRPQNLVTPALSRGPCGASNTPSVAWVPALRRSAAWPG